MLESSTAVSEDEAKKDTKHASDLLEGPDVEDEGIISTVSFVWNLWSFFQA